MDERQQIRIALAFPLATLAMRAWRLGVEQPGADPEEAMQHLVAEGTVAVEKTFFRLAQEWERKGRP